MTDPVADLIAAALTGRAQPGPDGQPVVPVDVAARVAADVVRVPPESPWWAVLTWPDFNPEAAEAIRALADRLTEIGCRALFVVADDVELRPLLREHIDEILASDPSEPDGHAPPS